MLRNVQHRLHQTIVAATGVICLNLTGLYVYTSVQSSIGWNFSTIAHIVLPSMLFPSYLISLRPTTYVDRRLRQASLLIVALAWFGLHCYELYRMVHYNVIECPSRTVEFLSTCIMVRINTFLGLITSLLVIAEVVVTWRLGPNASKLNETVIMSPVEQQHSYYMAPILMQEYPAQQYSTQQYPHTYHQPNAGQPSYPANQPFQQLQLQFLQPVPGQFVSSTPKYEDQSFLYQQQQQQYLQQQHHQQQQQQQQFQQLYPRHTYIAPAPGTTVTATPQPGGQPIVPYPSPGTSVAVSPVLPVGGFSTPSNAHTTISSNTPL